MQDFFHGLTVLLWTADEDQGDVFFAGSVRFICKASGLAPIFGDHFTLYWVSMALFISLVNGPCKARIFLWGIPRASQASSAAWVGRTRG